MISCKRATELISHSMEEQLTLKQELELKLHLFVCECCQNFVYQVRLFRKALRGEGDSEAPHDFERMKSARTLPSEAKDRIKNTLRQFSDD